MNGETADDLEMQLAGLGAEVEPSADAVERVVGATLRARRNRRLAVAGAGLALATIAVVSTASLTDMGRSTDGAGPATKPSVTGPATCEFEVRIRSSRSAAVAPPVIRKFTPVVPTEELRRYAREAVPDGGGWKRLVDPALPGEAIMLGPGVAGQIAACDGQQELTIFDRLVSPEELRAPRETASRFLSLHPGNEPALVWLRTE